jgi:hypothetical protein
VDKYNDISALALNFVGVEVSGYSKVGIADEGSYNQIKNSFSEYLIMRSVKLAVVRRV